MKTSIIRLTIVCLFTLISCKQDIDGNTTMHHDGSFHYWGMHAVWWFFALFIVIVLIVFIFNFKKRK